MSRHQLPAYSPLPLAALVRAAFPSGRAEERLKAALCERHSVEEVLLCGSGTQALQVALRAAVQPPAGENLVALPAFSCYDLASAVIGAGSRVVFYDVAPDTLLPDTESLRDALKLGPRALVVAPLFGYQPDWTELRSLAVRAGALLVEDAAQSFGSRWNGAAVGGLGDLSVMSFGRGKGWTAVQGGAVLGSRSRLEASAGALRASGPAIASTIQTLAKGTIQWALGRPSLYGIPNAVPGLQLGETVYHPPVPPHRMGSASVRLALETLEAAELEAATRRARVRILAARLAAQGGRSLRSPTTCGASEPGGLRFPVLATPGARRLLVEGGRALGILPSYPRPLPDVPQLRSRIVGGTHFPGAVALAEGLVTLPTHSLVSEADLSRIFELLRDADG